MLYQNILIKFGHLNGTIALDNGVHGLKTSAKNPTLVDSPKPYLEILHTWELFRLKN